MKPPRLDSYEKLTFADVEALAADCTERNYLEFKSSEYLSDKHHRNIKEKREIKVHKVQLKKCLAKECSAFANSAGGRVIFGVENDYAFSDCVINPKVGRQPITEWVADLLTEVTQPPLQNFEPYLLGQDDKKESLLVIDIPPSPQAPHQSLPHLQYYIRRATKAEPAEHWIVEAIRNRKKYPILVPSLLLTKTTLNSVSRNRQGTQDGVFSLHINIENKGSLIAKEWGIKLFSTVYHVDGLSKCLESIPTKEGEHMFVSKTPVFPSQVLPLRFTFAAPITEDQSTSGGEILISGKERLTFWATLYTDSSIPQSRELPIDKRFSWDGEV